MSPRKIVFWLLAGLSLTAALLFEPEILSSAACGLDSVAGEKPFIVYLEGRRRDMVAGVVFGGEKWPEVNHTSFVPVELEPGPTLDVVIATSTDLLVSFTGAVDRVRKVYGIEAGGHVAVHGVSREKITFRQSRLCFTRVGKAALASSSRANVRAFVQPYDPPKDIPCFGLECAATPIRWPRDIALPKVYSFDPQETVANAPLRKPELLDGWAGFAQLMDRGLLRRANAEEAEAALDRVRTKYQSRFSPQWRPQFGIDFVMVRPTRLPRLDHETGAAFRQATVLVPDSIKVGRQEDHCIVAMGRVAPASGYELALTKLHQPPPYVIGGHVDQKCLGDDQNPGPSRFEMADHASADPVPECQTVKARPDEVVVGIYDYRNYGGRQQPVRPLVDIRLTGSSHVVLVARTADTIRHWRITEAFPGQVASFVLAEPYYHPYDVEVDGLTPEQIVVDAPRLSDWRKQANGDPRPFQAYRSARLGQCSDRVSLMNWNPRYQGYSVSERGFDNTVKVWTGRAIDILKYVDGEGPVTIDADHGPN
jgi:hypothetical protein